MMKNEDNKNLELNDNIMNNEKLIKELDLKQNDADHINTTFEKGFTIELSLDSINKIKK